MSSSDSDFASNDESDNGDMDGNAGWADAMAKVLMKPTKAEAESAVLSKTKIETDELIEKKERRERNKRARKKRKWEQMSYVKPNVLEKDYERSLQKIATRGVVQLFNAVRKHQKDLDEKLKKAKTEGKKEKVMQSIDKKQFLDMLQETDATTKNKSKEKGDVSADPGESPAWKVLRDDFMTGNDMKDWDLADDEADAVDAHNSS